MMISAIWRLIVVLAVLLGLVACSGPKNGDPEAALPPGPALLVFYTDG